MTSQSNWQSRIAFLAFLVLFGTPLSWTQTARQPENLLVIDATAPAPAPETDYLQMGSRQAGKAPDGQSLSVNSRYLVLDGKPWLPVMGEFHYSRYPQRYWEEEILKMKAGGVQIIATYAFWIHHEEVEGQFDWSGQRDLREFVKLCGKHGMYVYPRIGPWAHGEVRNGGFPDWLLAKGPTRVNNPAYLSYVRMYYGEIGKQLKGLLWKDGGPVIGIQLENEYANRSPNGGAAYILKLKEMAIEAGLDLPLYTVTGWDNAVVPPRAVIPVFGGYPDEPWSGSLQELPPDTQGIYQFHVKASNAPTGIMQATSAVATDVELSHYPRVTAELGAGMQITYHRRVMVSADDVTPIALTALGSGVNLIGYYMYQGGTNPQGRRTTLQESQETDYPNDVPVKNYDFQAPLGEYGQMNESYRRLKVIHQFIRDFGSELAQMRAVSPDIVPTGPRDTATLRVAARTQGDHAFLFFNNYVRHYPLPVQKGVQVKLELPSQTLTVPREPLDIPSQSAFFWPVNLDLDGALLSYATAQPFAKMDDRGIRYYFFMESPGIAPEYAFDSTTISSLESKSGKVSHQGERTFVNHIAPSTGVAIEIRTHKEKTVRIVFLSAKQAQDCWKIPMNGHEHLLITPADVFFAPHTIYLRSRDEKAFSFSVFPDLPEQPTAMVPFKKAGKDGAFVRYSASLEARKLTVGVEKTRDASEAPPVKMGKTFDWRGGQVAQAPDDADFANAGVWQLTVPEDAMRGVEDVFLGIQYVGDVGRLYEGAVLIDDNFYNGTAWEVGLKRFTPNELSKGLELKILPLRKDAPIYMPKASWPDFGDKTQFAELKALVAIPEYQLTLTFGTKTPAQ
jgi:beta-galactosidase